VSLREDDGKGCLLDEQRRIMVYLDMSKRGWGSLHFTSRQVKDRGSTYLAQIERAIQQSGGVEASENSVRRTDEIQGKYILDAEEPL
jgi:hypothetical protein